MKFQIVKNVIKLLFIGNADMVNILCVKIILVMGKSHRNVARSDIAFVLSVYPINKLKQLFFPVEIE